MLTLLILDTDEKHSNCFYKTRQRTGDEAQGDGEHGPSARGAYCSNIHLFSLLTLLEANGCYVCLTHADGCVFASPSTSVYRCMSQCHWQNDLVCVLVVK